MGTRGCPSSQNKFRFSKGPTTCVPFGCASANPSASASASPGAGASVPVPTPAPMPAPVPLPVACVAALTANVNHASMLPASMLPAWRAHGANLAPFLRHRTTPPTTPPSSAEYALAHTHRSAPASRLLDLCATTGLRPPLLPCLVQGQTEVPSHLRPGLTRNHSCAPTASLSCVHDCHERLRAS